MATGSLRTVTFPRQTVSQTASPRAAYTRKTAPGLRLTRRGRVVVAGTAAVLTSVAMGIAATAAQAAGAARARPAAPVTIVRQGDSLWSVAERVAPDADARITIAEIIQLNSLAGTVIYPGERLRVPGA